VVPSSGSGSTQMFSFSFSDANGATDIASAQMVIDSSLSGTSSCYVYVYANGSGVVYLASDAGAFQSGLSIGSTGTAQNSQCAVNAAASSVSRSGTTLTINLALTFSPSFDGAKNVYMYAQNATLGSGWVQNGTWTVP